ncbi:hypothetical protein DQ04_01481110 [Trypanosoma grayi]|uniref:hypothetical protein n=1 Tax=Trypanosoma grayi TaxID=71804 RepID=UPI0004F47EA2|nr:hypothetical protein DQ04_01481110 [Trypanosoma grayi]KEG12708.1 hypothetical protein DQ04_01481110 [Trypanosoma grayi]
MVLESEMTSTSSEVMSASMNSSRKVVKNGTLTVRVDTRQRKCFAPAAALLSTGGVSVAAEGGGVASSGASPPMTASLHTKSYTASHWSEMAKRSSVKSVTSVRTSSSSILVTAGCCSTLDTSLSA